MSTAFKKSSCFKPPIPDLTRSCVPTNKKFFFYLKLKTKNYLPSPWYNCPESIVIVSLFVFHSKRAHSVPSTAWTHFFKVSIVDIRSHPKDVVLYFSAWWRTNVAVAVAANSHMASSSHKTKIYVNKLLLSKHKWMTLPVKTHHH